MVDALNETVPGGVDTRASRRLIAAHDASPYLLVPQAVVVPRSVSEVVGLMSVARARGTSLTFRSGGSSLSGQAGTRGVLVDTRRHFRRVTVIQDGALVSAGPGATIRAVNARLTQRGRALGPDPASEIACTIGGVVANNSSGMLCGVERNTYHTLYSAVLVLASGTVLDTGSSDADETLRRSEPQIYEGLIELRDRIRADAASVETIRRLFAIKNTMGYSVNSFLDYDEPVRILEHLMVGSEGTLAFVAEATFATIERPKHAATSLLFFPELTSAVASINELASGGCAAIELMDRTSLKVAARDLGLRVPDGGTASQAALLVEIQEHDDEALRSRLVGLQDILGGVDTIGAVAFTTDATERAGLWHARKGLYAAVAGARRPGTTALLEDIAVPSASLLATCEGLTTLLARHRYADSVIFGHAKDGNLHFLINEAFHEVSSRSRYVAFTEELVDLVLGNEGTLKAEHGTGRAMAPYVRRQYGERIYQFMREIKALLDPSGILNPGVLLSDDEWAHTQDLKPAPQIEGAANRCVECGYCEPFCPSKDLTLTPRGRIALHREIAVATTAGNTKLVRELEADYAYESADTCAADGMCQTACPVGIDTGDLARDDRQRRATVASEWLGRLAARRWGLVTRAAGRGLSVAHAAPRTASRSSAVARRLFGQRLVPQWSSGLPAGGDPRAGVRTVAPAAVYFPTCLTSIFGPEAQSKGVRNAFLALCARAGIELTTPDEIASMCCGMPWKSKGLLTGGKRMADLTRTKLEREVASTHVPVVVDSSSCAEGIADVLAGSGIHVLDAVEFVAQWVLPQLPRAERLDSLMLHPTCSGRRAGSDAALLQVARFVADSVVVPDEWGCCGFAGDRGLFRPELTESATRAEAAEVVDRNCQAHASSNRPCEIALARATGKQYRHILELLEEQTRTL